MLSKIHQIGRGAYQIKKGKRYPEGRDRVRKTHGRDSQDVKSPNVIEAKRRRISQQCQ